MKAESCNELTRCRAITAVFSKPHAKRLGDFDVAGKILSQPTGTYDAVVLLDIFRTNARAPRPLTIVGWSMGSAKGSVKTKPLAQIKIRPVLEKVPQRTQGAILC